MPGIRKRLGIQSEPTEAADSIVAASSSGPRGGIRRRTGGADTSGGSTGSGCASTPMIDSLKRDWCIGKVSAKQVQDYVSGAHAQGASGPNVERIAGAGASGQHPQNLQRALISCFGMPLGAPEFSWFKIPTKAGDIHHPFFLPHSWFASLHDFNPDLWASAVQGPDGAAVNFWRSMSDTPFVRNHPILHNREDLWSRCIPIGLHGDAGSFSHQESLFVFTMNSLLGRGSTVTKRFVIAIIKKSHMIAGTLAALFQIINWSFNVLASGITPETDHMGRLAVGGGRYLAQQFRGILSQVRGDWEFHVSTFKFPSWQGADNMCWMCSASSRGALCFTNARVDAAWRATRRTHEMFIADFRARGEPLPPLFDVIGFRLECVMIDILHCMDLGVTAHIVGNIMWLCVRKKVWGGRTNEANVQTLMVQMRKWYKQSPRDRSKLQGDLTVERIRTQGGWPKLKAKGAATRHLVGFACVLAREYLDPIHQSLTSLLARFYNLIDVDDMFLAPPVKVEMPQLGRRLIEIYSVLSANALANHEKLWKFSPKHHLAQHLFEWQCVELGNPKFYTTYADEDLVGRLIDVAESCHPKTLSLTAMYKWLLYSFNQ